VQLVVCCSKARAVKTKLVKIEDRFVARLVLRIQLFIVIGVVDVELVGTDPNDGPWKC
jgi:hypothetical protein